MYAKLRRIHADDLFGSGQSRVQGKGTRMGKAVQHPGILTELLNGQTVILLIQEKACLLTVLHIHQIADTVFHDFHIGIKGFADEAFDTLHALFFPFPGVASLIDAANLHAVPGQYPL